MPRAFKLESKLAKLTSLNATELGVLPIKFASLIISGLLLCNLPKGSLQYKLIAKISSSRVHNF
jgi:hypothetical protein